MTEAWGLPAPAGWPDGTHAAPEIMGPGVGLLDYDEDGRLDILKLSIPPPGEPHAPAPNRLFRQLEDGGFADVTELSGLGDPGFAQSLAVGDVDNDGDADVYFANYGEDRLYLNRGDGVFEDATAASGISGDLWSSSVAMCDPDRDGDLDIYVTHYLDFDARSICKDAAGVADYCDPRNFDGVPDKLYRNRGDGVYEDASVEMSLVPPDHGRTAKGLGVVCLDLTDDGWPDFFVANDGEPNTLWVNAGGTSFTDEAAVRGLAVNQDGVPEASMGIAPGDVDGDGRLDLLLTHLYGETNTLYGGTAGSLFIDRTAASGLSTHDLALTGFGCALLDFDLDGDLDLAVVNGRVYRGQPDPAAEPGFWADYAEPNLLFENLGQGRFARLQGQAGTYASRAEVSRGLAVGDLDGDGDPDLVVSSCDGGLRVYRNDTPRENRHWLRVRALAGARDALGAEVTLLRQSSRKTAHILPASSYMSSSDPCVIFGLGEDVVVDAIEVRWVDGTAERFEVGEVDRTVVVVQGQGSPV